MAATHLVVTMGEHRVQKKLTHPVIATEARNGVTKVKDQFQILEVLDKCREKTQTVQLTIISQ